MLKQERQQKIIAYVEQQGFVKIDDLATVVQCSSITIRRDLHELDQTKQLIKVHGGAMALDSQSTTLDVKLDMREHDHYDDKLVIAQKASQYIHDGMRIYLDAGTTIALLIPYLQGKNIIVYTHGVHHVPELMRHNIECHIVGGTLKPTTLAAVGETTVAYLQQFHFDCAFVGANAIDLEFGYSTPDEIEAMVKRSIIKQSKQSFVLAHSGKLDTKSYVSFAKLADAYLITELDKLDARYIKYAK